MRRSGGKTKQKIQDKSRQDALRGGDRARGDTHRQRCRRRRRPSRALRRRRCLVAASSGWELARPVRFLRGRIGRLRLRLRRVLRVSLLAQLPRRQPSRLNMRGGKGNGSEEERKFSEVRKIGERERGNGGRGEGLSRVSGRTGPPASRRGFQPRYHNSAVTV